MDGEDETNNSFATKRDPRFGAGNNDTTISDIKPREYLTDDEYGSNKKRNNKKAQKGSYQ